MDERGYWVIIIALILFFSTFAMISVYTGNSVKDSWKESVLRNTKILDEQLKPEMVIVDLKLHEKMTFDNKEIEMMDIKGNSVIISVNGVTDSVEQGDLRVINGVVARNIQVSDDKVVLKLSKKILFSWEVFSNKFKQR